MTDLRKAAKMAFDLLCDAVEPTATQVQADIGMCAQWDVDAIECIEILRQALAQPEQSCCCGEPTALGVVHRKDNPCYVAQPEQNSEAYGYAKRLAEAIWEKHYKKESPHWRPFHDVLGVLTQIDNMTCGLEKAQPEQEPVAWIGNADFVKGQFVEGRVRRVWWECNTGVGQPLYTAPPKREWQELTDEDWHNLPTSNKQGCERDAEIFNWIEDKLKEKNT